MSVSVRLIVREICASTSASISLAAPVSSRRKASRYMGTSARRRSLAESPTTSPSSIRNREKALTALGDSAPDFLSEFTPLSLPQPRGNRKAAACFLSGLSPLAFPRPGGTARQRVDFLSGFTPLAFPYSKGYYKAAEMRAELLDAIDKESPHARMRTA